MNYALFRGNARGTSTVNAGMIGTIGDLDDVFLWPEYSDIRLEADGMALAKTDYGTRGAYCLSASFAYGHPGDIGCE